MDFFKLQTDLCIFEGLQPEVPYYTWQGNGPAQKWYASCWYRCKACGCLWEVLYPDFPAKGFVRKFADGHYRERGY